MLQNNFSLLGPSWAPKLRQNRANNKQSWRSLKKRSANCGKERKSPRLEIEFTFRYSFFLCGYSNLRLFEYSNQV